MGRKRSSTPEDSISLSSSNESEKEVVSYGYPKREHLVRVNDAENYSSPGEIVQYKREKSDRKHKKQHKSHSRRPESSHKERKINHEHRDRSRSHRRKHRRKEDNSLGDEVPNISEKERERRHRHRKHRRDERHRKSKRDKSSHSRRKRRRKNDKDDSIGERSLEDISSDDNLENNVPDAEVKPEPISEESEDDDSQQSMASHEREPEREHRRESEDEPEMEPVAKRDIVKIEDTRQDWGMDMNTIKEEKSEEKEKINMGLSGKLTEDANMYNGVVIKYSQPSEARKPKRRWRWYIFKGDQELPFLPLHRQSAYLIGRDRKVADIPTDHPSCSKQHSVLQYRLVHYTRPDGSSGRTVKPYIIDLESANGTYVNNARIDPKRYVELLEKDVVKFGFSSREYVLLHEASKDDEEEIPDGEPEMSPVSLLRN